jgi:hypothetical protein
MNYSMGQLSDIENVKASAERYCRGVGRLDENLMKSADWPEATDDHCVFKGNAMEFVNL